MAGSSLTRLLGALSQPAAPSVPTGALTLISSASGLGTTAAINTAGANFLAVFIASEGTTSISDSLGNTWATLSTYNCTPEPLLGRWYYTQSPITGAAHTVTCTTSFAAVFMVAFSGVTANGLDVFAGVASTAPTLTSAASGSVTPTTANELVLASVGFGKTTTGTVGPSGFTVLGAINAVSGTGYGGAIAWVQQGTPTATNPAWSWSGAAEAVATVITFKAGAAVGGAALVASGAANALGVASLTIGSAGGAAAALDGTGLLASAGIGALSTSAKLAAIGLAQASGQGALSVRAALAGAGLVSAQSVGALSTAATLAGSGQAQAGGAGALQTSAALSGSGQAGTSSVGSFSPGITSTSLAGTGQVQAAGSATLQVSASLQGAGVANLVGVGSLTPGVASVSLAGSGQLGSQGQGALTVTARLAGSGQAQAIGAGSMAPSIALAGAGQLQAQAYGQLSTSSALAGAAIAQAQASAALTVRAALSGAGAMGAQSQGTLSPGVATQPAALAGTGRLVCSGQGSLVVNALPTSAGVNPVRIGASHLEVLSARLGGDVAGKAEMRVGGRSVEVAAKAPVVFSPIKQRIG